MASPTVEEWIYTTIHIENQWTERGTGFLVFRATDDRKGRIFLVTNKHVLNKDPNLRAVATEIYLHVNVRREDGSLARQRVEVPLKLEDGFEVWRQHRDPIVDVLAVDVTGLSQCSQIVRRCTCYAHFADQTKLQELEIGIGDEILVIGYPWPESGVRDTYIRHAETNFPLVRRGIIASRIGESLEEVEHAEKGPIRRRLLRGFLIDGAVIPGSSGSPVVLSPGLRVAGQALVGQYEPILLGIVAETGFSRIETTQGDIKSFAGLGFAFNAETIKETIEVFFEQT